MKFKVGDKVRLTREAIANNESRGNIRKEFIIETEVESVTEGWLIRVWGNSYWSEEYLEHTPEGQEFGVWEKVEVSINWRDWHIWMFVAKIQIGQKSIYITASTDQLEKMHYCKFATVWIRRYIQGSVIFLGQEEREQIFTILAGKMGIRTEAQAVLERILSSKKSQWPQKN